MNNICNPGLCLKESIDEAKSQALASPGFELRIIRFLQVQRLSSHVPLTKVFRGLDILGEILDEKRLVTLLRPFLQSRDPQIASKCVKVVGRRSTNMAWLNSIMDKNDERIRANLVESIWKRKETEVRFVLHCALADSHQRVAANAVCGLYLLDIDQWDDGLERLIGNNSAAFRKSGIWMLKSGGVPDAPKRLKRLIQDADTDVRRAAFDALIHLRRRR
jgi:HEAT repeat protein